MSHETIAQPHSFLDEVIWMLDAHFICSLFVVCARICVALWWEGVVCFVFAGMRSSLSRILLPRDLVLVACTSMPWGSGSHGCSWIEYKRLFG